MKKIYAVVLIFLFKFTGLHAQCDIGNYASTFLIPPAAFPYTNGAGITVNAAVVNITNLTNFTYNCGANSYTCSNPAWWINSASASITLTFSAPVCNLSVVVNGTNTTEEFYFASNNGPVTLSNFCNVGYSLIGVGGLLCNATPTGASGSLITIDNPAGATQYVITHNGLGSGSRLTLLDCYVPCTIVPPTHTITCTSPLSFCEGESSTISYTATGVFNAGNTFTAELSNAGGSFAAPVVIGSVTSTTSGTIPITIPPGTPAGGSYRIRVNSNNPPVTGQNNGANITIHALPNVGANSLPTAVCQGESVVLNGTGAATYTWSSGITNGTPFIPASTATYTVTGTSAANCTNSTTITVPVNPLPVVTAAASPSNAICLGKTCTLSGGGAVTYAWTSPVVNNVPFSPVSTATYTVTGTDANNCISTTSITITVNPLPVVSISLSPSDTICAGETVTLTANGASTYSWSPTISNGVPFAPMSTTTYVVTGSDANSCTQTAAQTIIVNPMPVVNLGNDASLCQGDSLVLNAFNPGATYQWQNNSVLSTYTVKQTGLYWVDVNLYDCHVRDSISVIVNPVPVVNLGIDTAICEGASLTLNAFCPGCTYQWQDNSTASGYTVTTEGWYSVNVTNQGCSSSDEIFVKQLPLPVVDLGRDTSLCIGDEIHLDAYNFGAKYLWSDQSTKPTFVIRDIGNYWVEVSLGPCVKRDDIQVVYSDKCQCPVYLPNAFSPNNDGLNDEFRLINANKIELTRFSIFNRWGEEVFRSTNPAVGWNGYHKGGPSEVGTYYYMVQYICLYNNKEISLQGDVILLR
jgi:gliding motility-associated-like protein